MTPREINEQLLQMTGKRAVIREYGAQHANWEIDPEASAHQWSQLNELSEMARQVEQSLPEFFVEFIEEKDIYCLIPRRSLPKESK